MSYGSVEQLECLVTKDNALFCGKEIRESFTT